MSKKKSGKLRTSFRKRHQGRVRDGDLTRQFKEDRSGRDLEDIVQNERLSGKGELTRKRTVAGADSVPDASAGLQVELDVDPEATSNGRVLSVHGLQTKVLGDDGRVYGCAIRQILKSLSTDQRNVVVAGDRVAFRTQARSGGTKAATDGDGMIEAVYPRRGILHRTSRGRQHVFAANVDMVLIMATAAEPTIKPALIDRMLLTAHHCGVTPVVVINKIDLIDPVTIAPLVGVFASLGYRVLMTSATSGQNIGYLRALMRGRQTVVAGQSGVGKSSLLNAIQPGLGLAVGHVSADTNKGRHTTTASRLIPLENGGCVFDTPGIRQFQLWDITPGEVGGLMPDFRPYVSHCRYPDCLHLAEDECAVKNAVADARIDARRYDSYCHLLQDDLL
ncbi:MAG: ribosome small subunit-dependent GTPase A [Planctomycetota bacterium]